jgi:hypothetical protein
MKKEKERKPSLYAKGNEKMQTKNKKENAAAIISLPGNAYSIWLLHAE